MAISRTREGRAIPHGPISTYPAQADNKFNKRGPITTYQATRSINCWTMIRRPHRVIGNCLTIVTLFYALALCAHAADLPIKADDPEAWHYLKMNQNFDLANPDLFWKIYDEAEKRAALCTRPEDTADFLEFALHITATHLREEFHDSCDKLLIANPKCFLDGAVLLKDDALGSLVGSYVKFSFLEQSEIQKVIEPFKVQPKYKRVMDLYYGSK